LARGIPHRIQREREKFIVARGDLEIIPRQAVLPVNIPAPIRVERFGLAVETDRIAPRPALEVGRKVRNIKIERTHVE